MDDNSPDGTINVAEAARRLGRSIEQVRRYLREGKLPGKRVGQQWFIDERAVSPQYTPIKPRYSRIGEPAATMETEAKITKTGVEALMKEIYEGREAIRRRLGRDLDTDIVEMLRIDREEH